MRSSTRTAAAALAAVLALTLATAPEAEAQELARLYQVTPKDVGAFEAALKKHVDDRIEHDDPWSWSVMQVVSGEDFGDFIYRSGGHEWADFDAYDQGFDAEARLHYRMNVEPTVEKTRGWITAEDTANSRYPADDEWENINLISVTTYHLKPGMQQQFNEVIGTIHGAIEDADWPVRYAWVDMAAGTGGPQKVLAIFHEDWADFEEPETPFGEMLEAQLGEEEAGQVFERLGETFRYVENQVQRWRKDLSVPPPAMRGGDGGS